MDYKTKYLKYKKKYLELKSQIGGVVLPNIKGTDDTDKKQASFFDIKSLENVRLLNKDHAKRMKKPKDCIDSCKCVDFKSTGKNFECEGVCNQYCKMHTNESIRIAVKEWFKNKINATEKYGHISTWDTSNVTNMEGLFGFRKEFNEDISNWNISNVENMREMFNGAKSFNQPLNNWNVSNVKNMEGMFQDAKSFNQPLNKWNVSNVKNMAFMFRRAKSFNQPLNKWNVSNVEIMKGMFNAAESFNQPLNNWNVSNVRSKRLMFVGAISMEEKNKPKWYYQRL